MSLDYSHSSGARTQNGVKTLLLWLLGIFLIFTGVIVQMTTLYSSSSTPLFDFSAHYLWVEIDHDCSGPVHFSLNTEIKDENTVRMNGEFSTSGITSHCTMLSISIPTRLHPSLDRGSLSDDVEYQQTRETKATSSFFSTTEYKVVKFDLKNPCTNDKDCNHGVNFWIDAHPSSEWVSFSEFKNEAFIFLRDNAKAPDTTEFWADLSLSKGHRFTFFSSESDENERILDKTHDRVSGWMPSGNWISRQAFFTVEDRERASRRDFTLVLATLMLAIGGGIVAEMLLSSLRR